MKYAKHIHVLSLLATVPAGKMTEQDATDAFDHLLYYMHKHWGAPLSAMTDNEITNGLPPLSVTASTEARGINALLHIDTVKFVEYLESLPPVFSEAEFPVAVARYMLRELQMPINHRLSKEFKTFYHRYGRAILEN